VDLRINRVVCQARLPRMDKSSSILMLHNHQSFIQVKFTPKSLLTLSNISVPYPDSWDPYVFGPQCFEIISPDPALDLDPPTSKKLRYVISED
jgi:hypothetical protein